MTHALNIHSTAIRLNDGLYSLNDLHKAAGGDVKYAPANFMRLDQTQALVTEISNSADVQNYIPIKTTRGKFGGTYVCRELVYAYAMWISPKFSLEVIRAFDAQHAQPVPQALTLPAETSLTDLALRQLRAGKFVMYFGEDGFIVLHAISRSAHVLEAEEFAGIIKEPGEIPLRLLPEIIMACATRLGKAS